MKAEVGMIQLQSRDIKGYQQTQKLGEEHDQIFFTSERAKPS
jgi:hypothetical protein